MSDAREFKDKAGARDLGDPATDLPLTLRVHPDDDPMDPEARRVIKGSRPAGGFGWVTVTGWRAGDELLFRMDEMVADWPYTSGTVAGAAFLSDDEHHGLTVEYGEDGIGRATCSCGEWTDVTRKYDAAEWWRGHRREARGTVAQAAERGDMGVAAFKGGA